MTIHAKLTEVLVCPACKGPLTEVRFKDPAASAPEAGAPVVGLDCPHCRLRYPIVDDIPVMLIDQAQPI
jgi:uncharacterized protein YbaR (Trm112 family)